ncbi:hypothetical protein [Brevibacterium aurantiacum]|uniref:Uncharacterized protein n=1 Tax=Brevibacterium aurantiacum TaxID=273384 RepID=A0A556CBG9_BREAU|nr:hypothetical protein [Brevibacterium aurantiacum]TSI14656.1 hypothetical protein FO013_15010 [Brevibacterium aurantiacum]
MSEAHQTMVTMIENYRAAKREQKQARTVTDGEDSEPIFRQYMQAVGNVFESFFTLGTSIVDDSEFDHEVWLTRVRAACEQMDSAEAKTRLSQWWQSLEQVTGRESAKSAHREMKSIINDYDQVWPLVAELDRRLEDQTTDKLMEAFKSAASSTPGMKLRVTEEVSDTVIRDETIFGPDEDRTDTKGVERTEDDISHLFGMDDSQAVMDQTHIWHSEAMNIVNNDRELSRASSMDDVLLSVKLAMSTTAVNDLEAGDLLPDIPTSMTGLKAGHAAFLRAQALMGMRGGLEEDGATYSRYEHGDGSAAQMLQAIACVGNLVQRAKLLYFPVADMELRAGDERVASTVPRDVPSFVVHDRPVLIGGLPIIGWLMHTDERGRILNTGLAVRVLSSAPDPVELTTHSCSFVHGPNAQVLGDIRTAVERSTWYLPSQLSLPGVPGSKKWRRNLAKQAKSALEQGSAAEVWLRASV